jgi:hypothetical protein
VSNKADFHSLYRFISTFSRHLGSKVGVNSTTRISLMRCPNIASMRYLGMGSRGHASRLGVRAPGLVLAVTRAIAWVIQLTVKSL